MNLKPEQNKWSAATGHRIVATNSMLVFLKNIKMLGMQQTVVNHVEDLRQREMDAAWGVRWLMFGYNASGKSSTFLPAFNETPKFSQCEPENEIQPTPWVCSPRS